MNASEHIINMNRDPAYWGKSMFHILMGSWWRTSASGAANMTDSIGFLNWIETTCVSMH